MTDITERFPECIGFGSSFGPEYRSELVRAYSGRVEANQAWQYPLHRGNVATGIKTTEDMEEFLRFLHAAAGSVKTFPFKDHNDFKSCVVGDTPAQDDQTILTAVGGETTTQVIKSYTATGSTQARKIILPIFGTLLIERNTVLQAETTNYTVDYQTGILTWVSPAALIAGDVIKAGYEYDVLCRFGSDALLFALQNKAGPDDFYGSGTASIIEDRG